MTGRRVLFLAGVAMLCAWTLLPIYLIAASAIGGRSMVNAWPKPLVPPDVSFSTITDFFAIAGVWASALYSVEAALLCVLFSLLLGLPALIAGLWLGFRAYGKLDDAMFRKVILVLLLLAGFALLLPRGL